VCKHRRESKVHFELGRCQKSVKLLVELEQQHRGKQFWPWLFVGRVLLMFSPGLGNDRMELDINLFLRLFFGARGRLVKDDGCLFTQVS